MDGLGAIGNFLASWFQGQGGQQQPPASIAGQSTPQQQLGNLAQAGFPGAQQMTAPAQSGGIGGGITDILSNPLTQGALATYLGTISQPRIGGLTRALGHGGLAGLGAFGQARAQQGQLPLQQAQLQEALAKTQQTTALTETERERQAAAQQIGGPTAYFPEATKAANVKAANVQTATQLELMATAPNITPDQATRLRTTAAMVRNAPDFVHPKDAITQAFTDPTLAGKKTEAEIKASGASAARSEAEAGLAPIRGREMEARAKFLESGEAKPMTDKDIESEATRQATAKWGKAPPPGWFESWTGASKAAAQRWQDEHDRVVRQLKAQSGALKATVAGAPESVPADWTEEPIP